MLKKIIRYVLLISISSGCVTGCSHVAGNIIPNDGPTMESIYDDAGEPTFTKKIKQAETTVMTSFPSVTFSRSQLFPQADAADFVSLDNPELKLYVFPHLVGTEMLPIPGYWTAFPAYPRRYYALPLMHSATSMEGMHS